MNPYLEQVDAWHDFHQKIIPAIAERLVPQVRPDYIVRIDEHVHVHEVGNEPKTHLWGRPDVLIAQADEKAPEHVVAVLEAPVRVRMPVLDIERLAYLKIQDRLGRQVITVIEVLSPSNKLSGSGREKYLSKREELFEAQTNLVEIDLLRGGPPLPPEDRPVCDYSVLVYRPQDGLHAGFWPIRLRDRLPRVPVPLKGPRAPAWIDLQEVLDDVYDASAYEDSIYQGTPDPPLSAADQAWAATLVPPGAPR